jgi:hypothetical protein
LNENNTAARHLVALTLLAAPAKDTPASGKTMKEYFRMTTEIYRSSYPTNTVYKTTPVSFKLDVNSCDGRTQFGVALPDYYKFTGTFLDGNTPYICFEQAAVGLLTERPFFIVAEGAKYVWNTYHVHLAAVAVAGRIYHIYGQATEGKRPYEPEYHGRQAII